MRSAPSVSFPVGRSRFGAAVIVLVCLLGLAALALWLLLGPEPGWRQALAGGTLLVCAGAAFLDHRRGAASAVLSWDGASWAWSGATPGGGSRVAVEVVWDLQQAMLVHLHTFRGGRAAHSWLWLDRQSDTEAWQALRRAVYSPADPQAQPEGASAS
ncbi:hypothetical protein WG922_18035 [Ramlibacter sp. AN1015]|uniref:hypothetical protein n=1 Tax=Ramlibacter sp. AN1015 TaxID=3133428 RepID=UPI0030C07B27